jgi:hypothetical protein
LVQQIPRVAKKSEGTCSSSTSFLSYAVDTDRHGLVDTLGPEFDRLTGLTIESGTTALAPQKGLNETYFTPPARSSPARPA